MSESPTKKPLNNVHQGNKFMASTLTPACPVLCWTVRLYAGFKEEQPPEYNVKINCKVNVKLHLKDSNYTFRMILLLMESPLEGLYGKM